MQVGQVILSLPHSLAQTGMVAGERQAVPPPPCCTAYAAKACPQAADPACMVARR